jgi:SpoVK/Ycf46/Vps4 family AAA+-type ATPase
MDGPDSRVLTLASCNALTIDAAGLRTGRMDSILEVPYPGKTDMAEILIALLHGIPGGDDVDTGAVASALPDGSTSGSDIRELVRRTVLLGGSVSTASLLAEVGVGRYKAAPVGGGTYL